MRRTVFLACLALVAPGTALAQQQAVSSQLISLHDALRLSPEQEAAWKAYTQAIAAAPQTEARHRAAAELLPQVPTPQRIALIEANMADDQAEFRRQGAAVLAFYDQLTPDQQRTFDRETLPAADGAQPQGPQGAPPPSATPPRSDPRS